MTLADLIDVDRLRQIKVENLGYGLIISLYVRKLFMCRTQVLIKSTTRIQFGEGEMPKGKRVKVPIRGSYNWFS